jgi:hypothetical protein
MARLSCKTWILAFVLTAAAILVLHAFWKDDALNSGLQSEDELRQAYLLAVEDARTAEESEVCHNLTAITDSNRNLIWLDGPGGRLVLAVTWTSWDGYLNKMSMNLSKEAWVTIAPQIKEFIAENKIAGPECVLRLEQLLGLPPHNGKKWLVEMWVNPKDLFRPSPDAEIDDSEAQLDFPENAGLEHRLWFDALKNASYGPGGYPWTRLGYTYDWGGLEGEAGLSEFVVRKDAEVRINKVYSTVEYCAA